jgi:hypothetical protein
MGIARINVMVDDLQKDILVDFQRMEKLTTRDEALARLLIDYRTARSMMIQHVGPKEPYIGMTLTELLELAMQQ